MQAVCFQVGAAAMTSPPFGVVVSTESVLPDPETGNKSPKRISAMEGRRRTPMADDETPPRWIHALLFAGAVGLAACTATLPDSGKQKAPAPARTAAPKKSGTAKRARQAALPAPTASP